MTLQDQVGSQVDASQRTFDLRSTCVWFGHPLAWTCVDFGRAQIRTKVDARFHRLATLRFRARYTITGGKRRDCSQSTETPEATLPTSLSDPYGVLELK